MSTLLGRLGFVLEAVAAPLKPQHYINSDEPSLVTFRYWQVRGHGPVSGLCDLDVGLSSLASFC